jgi:nitrogen fixation/metabolism regulation signal transduction histidine kinase
MTMRVWSIAAIKSQLGEDGQLLISISDTGIGLPAEKADQIFNAFFTTKPQGSDMGWPSVARFSSPMEDACGRAPTLVAERVFISLCPPPPRN